MSAPCQAVTQCQIPTGPGLNYLTETFSYPTFVAVETGPNTPPPLGWSFQNQTSTQTGESSVSQEAAGKAAWKSVISAFQSGLTSPQEQEQLLISPSLPLAYQEFPFQLPESEGAIEPIY